MNESQMIVVIYVFAAIMRIPRIVERWKAPLLRGPEWFFSVHVTPDFLSRSGAAILRHYRERLFAPWLVELPICGALFAMGGKNGYILLVVFVMTLLTRLNYYAARNAAEIRARRSADHVAGEAPVAVALSLETRALRDYTNWWFEPAIALAIVGSAAWVAYRYWAGAETHVLRGLSIVIFINVYLQIGLLLVKRGFVRARVVAPLEGTDQYLAWRDSLRRLSTTICDYFRILCAVLPPMAVLMSASHQWQGSSAQAVTLVVVAAVTAIATWHEWKRRLQYLEVARHTKPANFLLLPDIPDGAGLLCFRPSLPPLLLNGPNGYALNLASAPAKAAVIYVVGFAALWVLLTRFTA